MRRFFTLLTFAALLFAACDKEPNEGAPQAVDLSVSTESPIWFDAEGGVGEISYTLTGATADATISVTPSPNASWITDIVVDDVVRFTVLPNTNEGAREASLSLEYDTQRIDVGIMQHGGSNAYIFEATTLEGSKYYGATKSGDSYNYYLVLSTEGFNVDGTMIYDSEYFFINFFSADEGIGTSSVELPIGSYYFDGDSLMGAGTISASFTHYTTTYKGLFERTAIVDGSMSIEDDFLSIDLYLANGEERHITYEGSLAIATHQAEGAEGLSTMTSNYIFSIPDGVFVGAYVGDLMNNKCNTCQVFMWEDLDLETGEERGDVFQIDLQLSRGGTDISGIYTEGTKRGNFIPGWAENLGDQFMQQNSWYTTADYTNYAPIVRGTVTVDSPDGVNYIFTLDVVDDLGNAIRGTFKGWGQFTEW